MADEWNGASNVNSPDQYGSSVSGGLPNEHKVTKLQNDCEKFVPIQ